MYCAVAGFIRSMGSAKAKIEALRPVYTSLLADGVERFFLPPVDACPVCGEGTFGQRFTLPDLFQSKPGPVPAHAVQSLSFMGSESSSSARKACVLLQGRL